MVWIFDPGTACLISFWAASCVLGELRSLSRSAFAPFATFHSSAEISGILPFGLVRGRHRIVLTLGFDRLIPAQLLQDQSDDFLDMIEALNRKPNRLLDPAEVERVLNLLVGLRHQSPPPMCLTVISGADGLLGAPPGTFASFASRFMLDLRVPHSTVSIATLMICGSVSMRLL